MGQPEVLHRAAQSALLTFPVFVGVSILESREQFKTKQ